MTDMNEVKCSFTFTKSTVYEVPFVLLYSVEFFCELMPIERNDFCYYFYPFNYKPNENCWNLVLCTKIKVFSSTCYKNNSYLYCLHLINP
jgi:hypothetical protein